jgi:hypothetical protein
MKKWECFLFLFSCIHCFSCNAGQSESKEVVQSPRSLSGADGDELTAEDEAEGCSEEPSSLVAFNWDKTNLNANRFGREISLTVTNTSGHTVSIIAELRCSGLLNQTAKLALGAYELDAGESVPITVAADKIPIQNFDGASQMHIQIVASVESKDGTFQQIYQTTPLYYRHNRNYSRLLVFDRKHLIQQHGGRLSGRPAHNASEPDMIGRRMNSDGQFVSVTTDQPQLEGIQPMRGMSGGRLVQTSMSSGREDEEGSLVEDSHVE